MKLSEGRIYQKKDLIPEKGIMVCNDNIKQLPREVNERTKRDRNVKFDDHCTLVLVKFRLHVCNHFA